MLLELAILCLLSRHIDSSGRFAHKPGHLKAVYLAPARALVQASRELWLAQHLAQTAPHPRPLLDGAGEGQGLVQALGVPWHHLRRADWWVLNAVHRAARQLAAQPVFEPCIGLLLPGSPVLLAGDTGHRALPELDTADIICATPDKFDSATRSGMRFFADIALVLIGE